jgi:hypothetical protein
MRLAAVALALALAACGTARAPAAPASRERPVLLTLIGADDPRAVNGTPLDVRIGAGMLMEDVAHQVFERAAKLGFVTLSGLETHAHVVYDGHVYDCVVRLGTKAETDAWEAATAGDPAAQPVLGARTTIGVVPGGCDDVGAGGTASASSHSVVGGVGVSTGGGTRTIGTLRRCRQGDSGHEMYEYQRLSALGDPWWNVIGLHMPDGTAESAPRCRRRDDVPVDSPPVHRLTATVYKPV